MIQRVIDVIKLIYKNLIGISWNYLQLWPDRVGQNIYYGGCGRKRNRHYLARDQRTLLKD